MSRKTTLSTLEHSTKFGRTPEIKTEIFAATTFHDSTANDNPSPHDLNTANMKYIHSEETLNIPEGG